MEMSMTLSDQDDKVLIDWKPDKPQWWINGFNPKYQDLLACNLTATFTVDFSVNKGMYKAFKNSLDLDEKALENSLDSDKKGWVFEPDSYKATFTFSGGNF
jgi:hypothetical protein